MADLIVIDRDAKFMAIVPGSFAVVALADAADGAMGQAFILILMGALFARWLFWIEQSNG